MELQSYFTQLTYWYMEYKLNIYISLSIFVTFLIALWYTRPKIEESIHQGRFKDESLKTANNSASIILGTLSLALVCLVWGFDFRGLLLLSTSLLTLTGVALFANWSILSNVTAFFILLIHQSFRRGNYIRVIDLDNYIEGYVADINLFSTKLITEDRESIIYPNNLIISRPTIVNPRTRHFNVGKTTDLAMQPDQSNSDGQLT